MQKSILFLTCIILLAACRKEATPAMEAENSQQLLTAVVKTTLFNGSLSYNEKIVFEYDAAKKLIKEGDKLYYRDAQERITRIALPPNSTNRREITIHYANPGSSAVAYTSCDFKAAGNRGEDSLSGHDSIVYVHDNGRLSSMLEYFSDNGTTYSLYFTYNFTYDESGNIKQAAKYKTDGNPCFIYSYDAYDDKVNPFYTDDEVRMLETFWDAGNTSAHNLISGNHIAAKTFEYRADGRPRRCTIKENGVEVIRITYQYQ